jgi:hypothetical protein
VEGWWLGWKNGGSIEMEFGGVERVFGLLKVLKKD